MPTTHSSGHHAASHLVSKLQARFLEAEGTTSSGALSTGAGVEPNHGQQRSRLRLRTHAALRSPPIVSPLLPAGDSPSRRRKFCARSATISKSTIPGRPSGILVLLMRMRWLRIALVQWTVMVLFQTKIQAFHLTRHARFCGRGVAQRA